MFSSLSKLSVGAVFILLSSFSTFSLAAMQTASPAAASSSSNADAASAQSVPGQTEKIPQPGELGSPFPVEHSWNHFALEISGGYISALHEEAGYFSRGFDVAAGVVDHLGPHWNLLAEVQFFGLEGNSPYSNTDFVIDLGGSYDLLSRAATSPYVIGGIGYYEIGAVPPSQQSMPCPTNCVFNTLNAASSVGYNGGIGIRHRLYYGKRMAVFAEGRYHYIASGSSNFGQISLLPVSAGIRW